MKKLLENLLGYGALAIFIYVLMHGMFSAWDKEYEIQQQKIAEYRALLEKTGVDY
ncbi:hypothetical protein [Moraxella sp. Pampa]|uniref:hypothetical protein n=1 Tax=Moraxella sp. Pampa TaxID=3111978 RepID=UPI002B401496|nr:hypothetical protein [Moraxella sp. Pampa]